MTETLNSFTTRIKTGCGNLYMHFCFDNDMRPSRVFFTLGKGALCPQSFLRPMASLITKHFELESGIGLVELVSVLSGHNCPSPLIEKGEMCEKSCVDAIAKELYKIHSKYLDGSIEDLASHHMEI